MRKLLIFLFALQAAYCFFDIEDIMSDVMKRLPEGFHVAIRDIAEGLPARTMIVVRGESTKIR
jgi:hypothetical protein